jgi:diadenosine tetraphosphate (Ap4A) HIT family hydrolase
MPLPFRDGYPLSEGHTLVIPRAHRASTFEGSDAEQSAIWQLVAEPPAFAWKNQT